MDNNYEELLKVLKNHSKRNSNFVTRLKQLKPHKSSWKLWQYIPLLGVSSKTEFKHLQIEASQSDATETELQNQEETVAEIIKDIKQKLQIVENETEEVVKMLFQYAGATLEREEVKPTIVQVYERDGNTADFVTSFKESLQNKFIPIIVQEVSEIDINKPILILCQRRSRLLPDVDYSREHFIDFDGVRVAIVVIHCKEEHSLPTTSSQLAVSGEEQYKNVWFIDVAFTKELKFYECKMNTEAVMKLENFLTSDSPV
ncbi:uncharacterized protein LOC123561762 [Mercenaria mercenaria]|uniref:uncharacterized protein LOC123561762 n=1 Tax=Mercenaria mercenaria TaxID=6596 RepID=UPI00234E8BDE|nr:uncharacterized protein LOC123561762 [Mercenaria mercenaria]